MSHPDESRQPEAFGADSDGVTWQEIDWDGKRALLRRDRLLAIADKDGNFSTFGRDSEVGGIDPSTPIPGLVGEVKDRVKVTTLIDKVYPLQLVDKPDPGKGKMCDLKDIEPSSTKCKILNERLTVAEDGTRTVSLMFELTKVGFSHYIGALAGQDLPEAGDTFYLRLGRKGNYLTVGYNGTWAWDLDERDKIEALSSAKKTSILKGLRKVIERFPENVKSDIRSHLGLDEDYRVVLGSN